MVGGVKALILLLVVVLVGCHAGNKKNASKAKAIAEFKAAAEAKTAADWKVIEAAIREELEKPTGELTKADYEKVTRLHTLNASYSKNQLTDVKGLEKLTQLTWLDLRKNQLTEVPKGLEKLTQLKWLGLYRNPDLTKAQIDQLQKALPKCRITSTPKK